MGSGCIFKSWEKSSADITMVRIRLSGFEIKSHGISTLWLSHHLSLGLRNLSPYPPQYRVEWWDYVYTPTTVNKKNFLTIIFTFLSLLLQNWVYQFFCMVLEQKKRAMSPSEFMFIPSRNPGNLCWHIYIPLPMSNERARLIHQTNCRLRDHWGKQYLIA